MKAHRTRAVILDCLKRRAPLLAFFFAILICNASVFLLYGLPIEPFLYAAALATAALTVFLACAASADLRRAADRERMLGAVASQWRCLLEPRSLEEGDYHAMIRALGTQIDRLAADFDDERRDILDYYTAWVHQIKTPIAVMRMLLMEKDTEEHRALDAELFRIEQYVEMVLQYIRLDSETNDLVIREYALDGLLRQSIRKYAPQFVGRRLRLRYEPTDLKLATDAKWFACIIEQLLSNAVKYTPDGSVTVRVTDDRRLMISDTGIGIAAEDLPRVFEKGYTGLNGRLGQKSSGLGLYLCKRAADKLSIPIRAESEVGKGSTFILDLNQSP